MSNGPARILQSAKEFLRPYYLKWLWFRLRPGAKPPQWEQCWRFADVTPAAADGAGVPSRPGCDVLFLPMNDWHTRTQRPQQLARAMAVLGHRCFYLNPNLGREFPYPVRHGRRHRVCQLDNGIWEIHAGLPREPVFHHRLLAPSESLEVVRAILAGIEASNSRPLLIVSQFPVWNPVAQRLRATLAGSVATRFIYDCHDWLAGFSGIASEILQAEQELFEQADFVVFSARSLLERHLADRPWLARKAHLVRNGVDASRFAPAPVRANENRPIAGYVGAIEDWFDSGVVAVAAQEHPNCQFQVFGRVENRKLIKLAQQYRNIHLLGEIPYHQVPDVVRQFAVGLIPFAVNPLTLAADPIKLYEYFSCGLPVVSTGLPAVAAHQDLVYVGATAKDFARQVGLALAENSAERRQQRMALARRESWLSRARAILSLAGQDAKNGT